MQINYKRLNKPVFDSNLLSRSMVLTKLRNSEDEQPCSKIFFNSFEISWLSFKFVDGSLFCIVGNDCVNSILFE